MTINSVFSSKNRILLAKIQSAKGVDPIPTVALNAIEAIAGIQHNFPIEDLQTNKITPDKSKSESISGKANSEISFSCYWTGSGTRGTVSRISPLYQACGEDVTATPGTKVVNHPTNEDKYVTIYLYDINPNGNCLLHKFIDCVGNVVREGKAGQLATVKFSMKGVYTKSSDVANPGTPVYDNVQPITVKNSTLTFAGESGLIVDSF